MDPREDSVWRGHARELRLDLLDGVCLGAVDLGEDAGPGLGPGLHLILHRIELTQDLVRSDEPAIFRELLEQIP